MQKEEINYLRYKLIDGPLKVEKIEVMQGANYFSGGPVILMRLDLGEYDEVFTNQIPDFYEKLTQKLPSLYEHHCSPGKPGGFLMRLEEGTLLGHVCEHVAIELQTLAGMDVAYGKTRSTLKQGVYNIIFRFFDEMCGVYAGKAAINLINSLLLNQDFDVFKVIETLVHIREENLLGPSTQAIVDEAEKRKIPFLRLDSYNLVQLGTGKYQKRIRATITSDTNLIAVETADNKYLTYLMLSDAGIPVAETIKTSKPEDIISFKNRIKKPIVVKPVESYLGKNSMVNITSDQEIEQAYQLASEYEEDVLAQPYIIGKSYRLLVIEYKFVAASELEPPFIIGDGINTIRKLIDILNKDPERYFGDKAKLSKVEIDIVTERILKSKGYTLDTILPQGEKLVLKKSGNPKLGGTSLDVTDEVHEYNRFVAERAARVIGLNVAGVDIISEDISVAISDNDGKVIEINAAPDFRMHINPAKEKPRDVAVVMLNMLFPEKSTTRIPIFSITGTEGKTIAVKMLDHCLKSAGYTNGIATSEGLFIGEHKVKSGDMTFAEQAKLILKDPTIDCAILETSLRGILRKGLGYSLADYGIVLNIKEADVGKDDIKYIEDLAYAKSVVAEQVYDEGYAVLNAEHDLIMEMRERVYSNVALFSTNSKNPKILEHIKNKGLAAYLENNEIYISKDGLTEALIEIARIPFLCKNQETHILEAVLAGSTALIAHGVSTEQLVASFLSFSM